MSLRLVLAVDGRQRRPSRRGASGEPLPQRVNSSIGTERSRIAASAIMRTTLTWSDKLPERDDTRQVCYDVAFNPEGTQLIAGVGTRVLVYDVMDGDLLHSLKGHKDSVYCVAYAKDGKRFASGSADKNVIIWNSKAEGILRYSHDDSIQSLAYNPVTQQLASATATDFGLWSPEQRSVTKQKVTSRILCQAWTNDGQYIALGHYNGHVSIRDKAGTEKILIEKSAQVWCLAWNPSRYESYDVLTVGCFDGTISFYQLSGVQVGKEKKIGYDPLSLSYSTDGEFLYVGGTNNKVQLHSKDGTFLANTAEMDTWIWCVRSRPRHNFIAVGCEDGTIAVYQISFSTVHGLYQHRYAYRENMTDVVVQHLISDKKVKIKCRDYVKLIAMYKDRLAVQLTDRIIIYELSNPRDADNMNYRVFTKIPQRLECNLLVVTSHHFLLCLDKKLQVFTFHGVKEREWNLDSVIRYLKVVGGPPRREGILVGLKNGHVLKIFINNAFPVELIRHPVGIRCLDLSASRQKLSLVDENSKVFVYDLEADLDMNIPTDESSAFKNGKEIFSDDGATSVSWNADFEDMLCYTGRNTLKIKTGNFPVHSQRLQGFVVGFKASKIFCLHYHSMETIDVPQSIPMHRYLEQNDYNKAYEVACLGVTEADWRELGLVALQSAKIEVARKAFVRIRDIKSISLLNYINQELMNALPSGKGTVKAQVLAFQGQYQEAARLYAECGKVEKAMEMFSDLRQFEEAKQWAEEYAQNKDVHVDSVNEVIQRQAQWSEEISDFEAAADMYIKVKKFDKAAALYMQEEANDKLIEIVRAIPANQEARLLRNIAAHFAKMCDAEKDGSMGTTAQTVFYYAKEVYVKIGDTKPLVDLCVKNSMWEDAISIAKQSGVKVMLSNVYLSHARWLAEQDNFEAARKFYMHAGRPDEATTMLKQMCGNAIVEERFLDASFYYYQLACDIAYNALDLQQEDEMEEPNTFQHYFELSEIYHAYHFVIQSLRQPFTDTVPSILFNMGCYLLLKVVGSEAESEAVKECPKGVSVVNVLKCLSKYSEQMGAYNLARYVYNKLGTLNVCDVPFSEHNDLLSLAVRAKPFQDKDGLLPICFRCGAQNPLISIKRNGDRCISCGAKFERSFLTFEILPVMEFYLERDVSESEAIQLLMGDDGQDSQAIFDGHMNADGHSAASNKLPGGEERHEEQDFQVLRLQDGEEDAAMVDSFMHEDAASSRNGGGHNGQDVVYNRKMLKALHPSEVIVRQWPGDCMRKQFFRVVDPDAQVMLGPCCHFYEQDEYEMFLLEHGHTPFCRSPADGASAELGANGYLSGNFGLLNSDGRADAEGQGATSDLDKAASMVASSLETHAGRENRRVDPQGKFGSVFGTAVPQKVGGYKRGQ